MVGSFLPKNPRTLFAIAISAPSTSVAWRTPSIIGQLSQVVKAIIHADPSEKWEVLDFRRELLLPDLLNDDDLYAMLVIIDAPHKLKKLFLNGDYNYNYGCVNITGRGLEPLHSSHVLQQIDLGINRENKLRLSTIVPILDSIIESENPSLQCIELPEGWVGDREGTYQLSSFFSKYDQYLYNLNISCHFCDNRCGRGNRGIDDGHPWHSWIDDRCGKQRLTCNQCLKHFCKECPTDYDIDLCETCDRYICCLCEEMLVCPRCHTKFCYLCTEVEDNRCSFCLDAYCSNCDGFSLNECRGCNEVYCQRCYSESILCACSYGSYCSEECRTLVDCKCEHESCDESECEHESCDEIYCSDCSSDNDLPQPPSV